ncbi:F-box/LRR-repeat protein 16 [Trachemys scripta elegans]|uniref:F-box/LRR-repeat protein 16 n=1 Tax=Trachemys scripta elegans TaxID=31138 RepID=UPI0015535626|nr:F-box/LRR-repeat protein 16 [Trachemys scripta elegans]
MSNQSTGDTKPPCLPRNGLVKIPNQPNGLGSASITKGTPAVKNRLCQPSSMPAIISPALSNHSDLPIPSLASPLSLATLAGVPSPSGTSMVGLNLSEASSTNEHPSPERHPGSPTERQLAVDEKILNRLFWYFSACEKCVLAQVCKVWRRVLYQSKFWVGLTPVLHTKELYNTLPSGEKEFVNLQGFAVRGFDSFCLVGVSDLDICEFIDNYPLSKKGVKSMSLKRSTITDAGLEVGLLPPLWLPGTTEMRLSDGRLLFTAVQLPGARCVRITDTGLSYLSTMSSLRSLYLRWCCQVQDFGLKHLLGMRSLRLLSLAGCPLLTTTGLSGLVQLQDLEELELTNCPGATPELFKYFSQHLPHCMVIE